MPSIAVPSADNVDLIYIDLDYISEALELAATAGDLPWPDVQAVGGWWNRQFNPEIDLIGADRSPVATRIRFTGSIKWLGTPFDHHDLAAHRAATAQVPGYDAASTRTLIASRAGVANSAHPEQADLVWGPDEVVAAWR